MGAWLAGKGSDYLYEQPCSDKEVGGQWTFGAGESSRRPICRSNASVQLGEAPAAIRQY
jgi:hypothetical protein